MPHAAAHGTRYCTTDFDLFSAEDLTALAAALEVRGLNSRRVDGEVVSWLKHVTDLTRCSPEESAEELLYIFKLRIGAEYDEPEPEIAAMLAAVEALDPPQRSAWAACSLRVFDIAYD